MGKAKQSRGNPAVVIGYVRASTDRQELGPASQRDAMARWCAARGAVLAATFEDLGVSGATALEKRPGLLAALDALAEHGAGVLLVAKRDRLARDPFVAAMVERLAAKSGARITSAAGEGTDGDDPASVLMRRMLDAFSETDLRAVLDRDPALRERTAAMLAGELACPDLEDPEMMTADEQVSIRVPSGTQARAEALIAALDGTAEFKVLRVSKSAILRLAIMTGLDALEAAHGKAKRRGA